MGKAEIISKTFQKHGFSITGVQAKQFEGYYDFLIEENQKYNLTAITDFQDVVNKHFIDSAVAINKFHGKILDVGSGAGFPGVVLAILNPKLEIVLLDSLQKRVSFLNLLAERLNLKNVKAIHCRIEDFDQKEKFDCVTARAVANLSTLAEYLLPFVKIGGKGIIYKGADCFEEVEGAQKAIKLLGGQLEEIQKFDLDGFSRSVITLRKIASSPAKYPRSQNLPRKQPL